MRTPGALSVDGRLDEEAWARAPVTREWVQLFPAEGARPSEQTEVRVLYDDETLYVGVRCFDAAAAEIMRPLGRRDSPPQSDLVEVYIAPSAAGRNAGLFAISAGGVQADAWVYDDDRLDYAWDEVWEGAASVQGDVWTAVSFRNQAEMPARVADGESLSIGPRRLGSGPTVDGVFLKFVHLLRV
jgi:hypothetical protein